MQPPRLFSRSISEGRQILSPEESHHAAAVLRLKSGDEVVLFDGAGTEGFGEFERPHRRVAEVSVSKVITRPFELPRKLTLAVSMPKAHRQGFLIEKCTELGLAAIWPMIAAHSVGRPRAAAIDKWARRAIEAAKQAGRAWVPEIAQPRGFREAIENIGRFDGAGIADLGDSDSDVPSFLRAAPARGSIIVFIGPEGGWTDEERARAVALGVRRISLAPTTLRTETAAVAVCAAVAMQSPRQCDEPVSHSAP